MTENDDCCKEGYDEDDNETIVIKKIKLTNIIPQFPDKIFVLVLYI
jgi:hypothetical protein